MKAFIHRLKFTLGNFPGGKCAISRLISRTWIHVREEERKEQREQNANKSRGDRWRVAPILFPWSLDLSADRRLARPSREIEGERERERRREIGRQMPVLVFLSGSGLLPKAALKGGTARERSASRHQRERLYKRQKHLPRAHGVEPRSLIAPEPQPRPRPRPGRLRPVDSGPYAHISLPTTKNHRLEKEKSATHVYLSHKVAESLTSFPPCFP